MANPIRIKGMTRHNLYEQFARRGYKVGAEIGVFRGRNALDICRTIPGVRLYGIDHWQREGSFKTMQKVMKNYIRRGRFVVVKNDSITALKDFKDESLDFVYIDADHNFDSIIQDLIHWSRKVRNGGTVSGHDYFINYKKHVINAVDAFTCAHNIDFYITDEKVRKGKKVESFFWEKC
ncbi:MAG: class I SAM-dependent methyltransferase [Sedimentisphaerales bacterium]|nr:class I SAM-dependent methyltransferase [Sedimentisphaerales bacterium]